MTDESDDETPPASGPFCRHFGDPADCAVQCASCGHACSDHAQDDDDSACCVLLVATGEDCPCNVWAEPPEERKTSQWVNTH